jgi:hypothetical protein
MAEPIELEPCRCGGDRIHQRKVGAELSLCGRATAPAPASNPSQGLACFDCAKKRRALLATAAAAPGPAPTYAACMARGAGKDVHLVQEMNSPTWVAEKTVCGRTVDALIAGAKKADVTCRRCASVFEGT